METPGPAHHHYIDRPDSLAELAGKLGPSTSAAMDTEADSLHRYTPKVCLIQLTISGENYILDPLAGLDLSDFLDKLSNTPLIVHGGDYDLRMMLTSLDFRPRREVFDTLVAAQLLGHTQFGLVALAEHYLQIQLTKHGQKSDWSRRPLTEEQLAYACDDTRFLERLADLLKRELSQRGRLAWHQESCAAMVRATANTKPPPDPDDEWRIKGLSYLTPKEMAYVRGIWYWREEEARQADRPPFKIMPNQLIIDLSIRAAANPQGFMLEKVRLPRHCRGRRMRTLASVFERTKDLPESQWPLPRKSKAWPFRKPRIDLLKERCAEVAQGLGIEPSVIAPRAALESIARERPEGIEAIMKTGPLLRWQSELIVPIVDEYLRTQPAEPPVSPE